MRAARSSGDRLGPVDGSAGLQLGLSPLQGDHLAGQGLVRPGRLAPLVDLAFHGGDVCEDQLQLEDPKVGNGVGRTHHVLVLERPQHQAQGVRLPDPGEEPVAEPLPGRRPGNQPGNVDELDRGRHHLAAGAHDGQLVEPVVRDVGHADGTFRRRERVGGHRDGPSGEGVEEA